MENRSPQKLGNLRFPESRKASLAPINQIIWSCKSFKYLYVRTSIFSLFVRKSINIAPLLVNSKKNIILWSWWNKIRSYSKVNSCFLFCKNRKHGWYIRMFFFWYHISTIFTIWDLDPTSGHGWSSKRVAWTIYGKQNVREYILKQGLQSRDFLVVFNRIFWMCSSVIDELYQDSISCREL